MENMKTDNVTFVLHDWIENGTIALGAKGCQVLFFAVKSALGKMQFQQF